MYMAINTIATLPLELLLIIFEHAWDRNWMKRSPFLDFALVCSTWRPIAQRCLFTDVTLGTPPAALQYLRSIQDRNELGQFTKILAVWPDVTGQAHDIGFSLVRSITSICSNIYQLTVHIPTQVSADRLMDLVHPRTSTTLQALDLGVDSTKPNGEYIPGQLSLYDTFHFIHQFSRLSHLTLFEFSALELPSPPQPLPPSPPFNLYEFNWVTPVYEETYICEGFEDTLQWLFGSGSPAHLRVVEFAEPQWEEARDLFLQFLGTHGSNLHSLRLWIKESDLLKSSVTLHGACPNLRELVLPICSLTEPIRSTLPTAEVQHLDFAVDGIKEAEMQSVVDWLASLPKIRRVTVRGASTLPQAYSLPSFWSKCTARDIRVNVLPKEDFPVLVPEDTFRATRFPRDA
ncbi:hypothetical protein FRC03_010223, partial [Tulasnella sp. 419]